MVSEYKCVALNVDMEATVGDRPTVDALIAASSVDEGAREEDAWAAAAPAAEPPRGAKVGSPRVDEVDGDDAGSETGSIRGSAGGCGDGVMAYFGDNQARMHACFLEWLFVEQRT